MDEHLTERKGYRIEHDSMGEVYVPEESSYGAQTMRSLEHFSIGEEKMPLELIEALLRLKMAAAKANASLNLLKEEEKDAICRAGEALLKEDLRKEFPLHVWQTGSGTQTNMNANEVLAYRANQLLGEKRLHPNDHINRSQSSNDVFPSAMHVAAILLQKRRLEPELNALIASFRQKKEEMKGIVKIGRTHLQDAVPIRFSDEIQGWIGLLENAGKLLTLAEGPLYDLALGGTAVGTGLNAPKGFASLAVEELSKDTSLPFRVSPNFYHALSSRDSICFYHGALRTLAANLMKIANDLRWLGSGPRCGLGEVFLPENEPGSSIMPGKVNPTQCEAVTMVAIEVMGNDTSVEFAASQGNFQLNVFLPLIIFKVLESERLLADVMNSFRRFAVDGFRANREKMQENLNRSLMLVTALTPYIGYEKAAKAAKKAHLENLTLKEAVLSLSYMKEEEFDKVYHPEEMTGEEA